MNDQALKQALLNLPDDAQESIVDRIFVPEFLQALGFGLMERVPHYTTGIRPDKVDYALRHNTNGDIFLATQSNPYILLELKGRHINLSDGSTQYQSTFKQLKGYLLDSNCKTVQWGIREHPNCAKIKGQPLFASNNREYFGRFNPAVFLPPARLQK
ncbi:hypothetical protein [Allocoleopsis franciscana]|uniref:Type I restriction enzyme R protein N-terminal domain-containing protein n=1 Tax=Allocoleopsis franciscana PCC 7113 TaxID=1173027 RepID=K9WCR0_9CYAN|nr:hypothetical protein [Allocoleopsis franciscana]AFZ17566.1 hypothetical protein Mic7113_1702 [Allocoleopsis franciscana PCC 7113]